MACSSTLATPGRTKMMRSGRCALAWGWWDIRATRPHQHAAVFILGDLLGVEELVLEGLKGVVIQVELHLECPIGHTSPPLEHGHRLVEHLLKGHRPPSLGRCGVQKTVWEWDRSFGHVYHTALTKESRHSWARMSASCTQDSARGSCYTGHADRLACLIDLLNKHRFFRMLGQSMTRTTRPECGHSSSIGEDHPSVFGQLLGMPSDDIEKLAAECALC